VGDQSEDGRVLRVQEGRVRRTVRLVGRIRDSVIPDESGFFLRVLPVVARSTANATLSPIDHTEAEEREVLVVFSRSVAERARQEFRIFEGFFDHGRTISPPHFCVNANRIDQLNTDADTVAMNWIPFSERHPTILQDVLVIYKESGAVGRFHAWWDGCACIGSVTHWAPFEPPPKPDAFEVWWEKQQVVRDYIPDKYRGLRGNVVRFEVAKEIWDAAIASTKEQ
jgi:hypothetical protein